MPHSCRIPRCTSKSIATCLCCNRYLCRSHFIQHDFRLRSKFNVFSGKIDDLTDQLQTFDVNKITNDFRRHLDEWRFNSYRVIDQFYEKKCDELYRCIQKMLAKPEEQITQLRLTLAKMINVQKIAENNLKKFTSDIQSLMRQIDQIKHVSVQSDINPLVINDDLIHINLAMLHKSDWAELSSPYQIIPCVPFSSDAIASNGKYLLLHQNSNLCLINEHLLVADEKKWPNDWIRDMCWSQRLKAFFLITFDNVYLVKQDRLTIKHIKTIRDKSWQSCTCSDTCLYLSKDSWNSPIDEFSLKPSIEFRKHCERLKTENQNQRIDSIEYYNETLALIINDQSKQEIFVELRSLATFDRLWLCKLSIDYSERSMQCCVRSCHAWVATDRETSSVFHITDDGNLEDTTKYRDEVHCINFFGKNRLAISTNDSINFHEL